MNVKIRKAKKTDIAALLKLHRDVSFVKEGIARKRNEVTKKYINEVLQNSLKKGFIFVAEFGSTMVGSLHCYRFDPECFKHTISNLTIVVHPDFHSQGIGRKIFYHLLHQLKIKYRDIMRVELTVRQSNPRAIKIYQSLGFEIEGIMKNRILDSRGQISGDTMMAWLNPNFQMKL